MSSAAPNSAAMGSATRNIDSTSAAGVTMALNSTIATTTTRHERRSVRAYTIPRAFSSTISTGMTKAMPVATMVFSTKST